MTATLPATYEHGVLRLGKDLPLPEHAAVMVTVQFKEASETTDDEAWAAQGKAALAATWDNEADEVFNELAAQ